MENPIVCPTCKSNYEAKPETCPKCGFPFSGTDKEKSVFIGQQILKKGKIKDTTGFIKVAQIILWIVGGMNLLIAPLFFTGNPIVVISSVIIGVLFVGFGVLAYQRPFISILIPLIILLVNYTIEGIMNTDILAKGIILKFLFVAGLVFALIRILEAEHMKKENDFMKEQDYKQ